MDKRARIYIKTQSRRFHGFCTLLNSQWILHSVYLWNLFLHYLFIYVFLLLTEVQKCYVFWHCARLFVSRNVIFSGTVPDYLFMYLFYFQKSRNVVFSGTLPDYLFMYLYYFQKSRNVIFSGTLPDYLFMYLFYFQKSRNVIFSVTVHFRFISEVSFWNRHHDVLNKYKYCEQTLFFLFCYT